MQPLARFLADETIRSPALLTVLRLKKCLERRVWDLPELELQQVRPPRVREGGPVRPAGCDCVCALTAAGTDRVGCGQAPRCWRGKHSSARPAWLARHRVYNCASQSTAHMSPTPLVVSQGKKPPFGNDIRAQLAGLELLRPSAAQESAGGARELRVEVAVVAGGSRVAVGLPAAAGVSDWTLIVAGRGPQGLLASRRCVRAGVSVGPRERWRGWCSRSVNGPCTFRIAVPTTASTDLVVSLCHATLRERVARGMHWALSCFGCNDSRSGHDDQHQLEGHLKVDAAAERRARGVGPAASAARSVAVPRSACEGPFQSW